MPEPSRIIETRVFQGGPIRRGLVRALGLIWPQICPVCLARNARTQEGLCPACAARLRELPEPRCPGCGGTIDGVLERCSECLRRPPRPWRQAVSVFAFRGPVREVIHRFKYRGQAWLAAWLGARAARAWMRHGALAPDVITPVPLHWRREWSRGYNQSRLLAGEIGRRLGVPVHDLLERPRATPKQANLDAEQRLRNMRNAFRVRPKPALAGHSVLIVDDVFTTGATLGAAAETLTAAGAGEIVVLTAARG